MVCFQKLLLIEKNNIVPIGALDMMGKASCSLTGSRQALKASSFRLLGSKPAVVTVAVVPFSSS